MLRGLSASTGAIGAGENNLDIEGGVSERRTAPPATIDTGDVLGQNAKREGFKTASAAPVEVTLEDPAHMQSARLDDDRATQLPNAKPNKAKKQVAFRADRPDLYDF